MQHLAPSLALEERLDFYFPWGIGESQFISCVQTFTKYQLWIGRELGTRDAEAGRSTSPLQIPL